MSKSKYNYIIDKGKRKLLHRYVMEQFLGRELLSTEIIHHINGDQSDNRISNLELLTNINDHIQRHKKLGTYKGNFKTESKLPLDKTCDSVILYKTGTDKMKEELLTKTHLAIKLNVSKKTIERYMAVGMPVIYIGDLPRFQYSKVIKWFVNFKPEKSN